MDYLSPADLIVLHQMLLNGFGGMPGITEAGFGRLEAAAAVPRASVLGDEAFVSLPEKAAALCHAIVRAHPFSDGNKRVALVALDVFLAQNGHALTASNDEAYATMMALAQGTLDRAALVAWVERRCVER